jgi:putative ABC transport system permease protein
VLAQIRSLGANLLLVTPGSAVEGTVRLGGGTRPTLTEDDAAAIVAEVPSVRVAAPAVDGSAHLVRGNQYVFELMRG